MCWEERSRGNNAPKRTHTRKNVHMQTDKCCSARTHTHSTSNHSVLFPECSRGQTLPCIWPSYHLFSSLFGSYQHSPVLSQRLRLHDLVQLLLNWPTLIQWSSVKRRWETWKPPVDVPHSPPCQVSLAWPHIPFTVIKSRNLIKADNGRRGGEKLSQLCHFGGDETTTETRCTSSWPPKQMTANGGMNFSCWLLSFQIMNFWAEERKIGSDVFHPVHLKWLGIRRHF